MGTVTKAEAEALVGRRVSVNYDGPRWPIVGTLGAVVEAPVGTVLTIDTGEVYDGLPVTERPAARGRHRDRAGRLMAGGQELLPLVDMLRRSGIESTIECLGGNVWGVKAHTRAGFEVLVTREDAEDSVKVDVGLYDPEDPSEPVCMATVMPSLVKKTLREWGA